MSSSGEMASNTMRFMDRMLERERAGVKVGTLQQLGLRPEQVRARLAATAPATLAEVKNLMPATEVKRAMARQVKPGSCGRGGLPDYVVQEMYADYKRLKSLAKVGALYGRTRQSIYSIFSERGLALNSKVFQAKIHYGGRCYTPDKNGYYRDTIFRAGSHKLLHHVMWIALHGPIPAGHQVFFKDGDRTNFKPGNLDCLPIAEVTLYHHQRKQGKGRAA